MPDFTKRSLQKELLDNPGIPFEDIRKNMQELNVVNTWLGGHQITRKGFKKLAGSLKTVSVCEIGCGGGDNLLAIHNWCKQNNVAVSLTGIDINPNCVAFATEQYPGFNFICSDYKEISFDKKPDIIFNSLFCHHFSNEEVADILHWMKENASLGFFINDLHRHPFAYYSIKALTKIFSRSYLVKNDAPVSVLRGFTKAEWNKILAAGNINAKPLWEWAFRHLIVFKK